jgi:hypothetical protein
MYGTSHESTMSHMGVSGSTLMFPLAIVETGEPCAPHLAKCDWSERRSAVSLCGRRVTGSAQRGYETGCPDCAQAALRAGYNGVQGHDGAVVNLARVPRLTGRRRGIPGQVTA